CGPTSSIAAKLVADQAPRSDHGLVTGLTMVGYYVGGVLGAQICAAILASHTIGGTTIPTEGAYAAAFFVCAAASVTAIPFAALAAPKLSRARGATATLPATAGNRPAD